MESNSYLIEPNSQYRQELRLLLSESEISELYQVLVQFERDGRLLPKVAKDLRMEFYYMLFETREFNRYLKEGGEP